MIDRRLLEKLKAVARAVMLHDEIGVDVARLVFDRISENLPLLTVLLADLLKSLDLAIARKIKVIEVKSLLEDILARIHNETTIIEEHKDLVVDFILRNTVYLKFPELCGAPLLRIITENSAVTLRVFSSCSYESHLHQLAREELFLQIFVMIKLTYNKTQILCYCLF